MHLTHLMSTLFIALAYERLASGVGIRRFFCSFRNEKSGEVIHVKSNITIGDCTRMCLMAPECVGYNVYNQELAFDVDGHSERVECVLYKTLEHNSTGVNITKYCEKIVQCPPGYELGYELGYEKLGHNSCYKFVVTPALNLNDTRLQCQSDGGHLVVPETPEENEWLAVAALKRGLTTAIFLGAYRDDSGDFVWSTTMKPPEYYVWMEYNATTPTESMRLLLSSKKWRAGVGTVERN